MNVVMKEAFEVMAKSFKDIHRGPHATLKIIANNIPRMDSDRQEKSDPYLEIYEMKEEESEPIYRGRTDALPNDSAPRWNPLKINVTSLQAKLLFKVYDEDVKSNTEDAEDDFICSFETSMDKIKNGSQFACLPKSELISFKKTPTIIVDGINKSSKIRNLAKIIVCAVILAAGCMGNPLKWTPDNIPTLVSHTIPSKNAVKSVMDETEGEKDEIYF